MIIFFAVLFMSPALLQAQEPTLETRVKKIEDRLSKKRTPEQIQAAQQKKEAQRRKEEAWQAFQDSVRNKAFVPPVPKTPPPPPPRIDSQKTYGVTINGNVGAGAVVCINCSLTGTMPATAVTPSVQPVPTVAPPPFKKEITDDQRLIRKTDAYLEQERACVGIKFKLEKFTFDDFPWKRRGLFNWSWSTKKRIRHKRTPVAAAIYEANMIGESIKLEDAPTFTFEDLLVSDTLSNVINVKNENGRKLGVVIIEQCVDVVTGEPYWLFDFQAGVDVYSPKHKGGMIRIIHPEQQQKHKHKHQKK